MTHPPPAGKPCHIPFCRSNSTRTPWVAAVARLVFSAILLSAASSWGRPSSAEPQADTGFITPEELTDQHVVWAIDTLVESLYALRDGESGRWDTWYADSARSPLNVHITGQTTLAVYALLAAGQSYQDPRLNPAILWLRRQNPDYTYVRSLRCHIWALLPRSFEPELDRDAQVLMSTYGYESGSWGYSIAPPGPEDSYDNSLTQYGTLGLWEAAKRGTNVPQRFWKRIEDHYLRTQIQGGGWYYRIGRSEQPQPRGSMTAAGLTALFITQDFLHAAEHLEPGQAKTKPEEAIEQGLRWFDENFTVDRHPGVPGDNPDYYYFYYLYGLERVGLASGIKRFGDHDWFREGAAAIINRLCRPITDGAGALTGFRLRDTLPNTGAVEVPVVQLSFALLFLSHGRAPIVLSKLEDHQLAWNNRPRDAANLAAWLGAESERRLGWQIVNISRPTAEWLESPIAYLASHETVPYAEQHLKQRRDRQDEQRRQQIHGTVAELREQASDQDRIQQYIESGGLLLTNADVGSESFTKSITALGTAMFPEARWRKLPGDHWAYTLSSPVRRPPELLALTNGVRELIIHCPTADLGAALQVRDENGSTDLYATLTNIYLYATQRGLLEPRLARGARAPTTPDSDQPIARTLNLWRGRYGGNWNPEPGADRALAAWLRQERTWELNIVDVPLTDLLQRVSQIAPGTPVRALLWIRGVETHTFTPDELAGVRAFINRGGTLLLETVGGVGNFAAAAEQTVLTLMSDNPADTPGVVTSGRFRSLGRHPVVTGQGLDEGYPCSRVAYRLFTVEHLGGKETRPRLRGLQLPDLLDQSGDDSAIRPSLDVRIFSSREDLTFAQLDQPRWGISGYETRDAHRIITNLLIYSNKQP